ncbi:MAG: ATP-binding cassette domain-containing protein [Ruminococcus sp.]|nr:ATP-binding cassette domain-containing protein [Ruminococcus sp.]
MEYVLKTNALCKQYKNFKALNGLTMNVPKGSIYGFVGRNGAGKTTLIRIICGLQFATQGGFELYGQSGEKLNEARRRVGAVVETPSIFPEMTAEENLKHQFRIIGVPSFEKVKDLLELVGLSDTGKKKAKDFSLGMRQRLGIAIALCGDPDFLILDEPINGLDPQGIIEVRELILKLNRERNITVLISSHILDELSKLATHYGFIDKGAIVREMSADELNDACRKCVTLNVSDTGAAAKALEKLGYAADMTYKIYNDGRIDVFAQPNITQLVHALDEEDCELITVKEHDETLEGFFISLVGGDSHD